jgi:hypothetical protein
MMESEFDMMKENLYMTYVFTHWHLNIYIYILNPFFKVENLTYEWKDI